MNARNPHRAPEPRNASSSSSSTPALSDHTAERLAYSVSEAARLTGLSRDLLYDQMRQGNLDYIKVGRRRLITRQHLEQFLDIAPSTWRIDARADATGSDAS